MVTVHNIDETIGRLQKLTAETQPQWGLMTAQHMVEHLTMTIRASQGKMMVEQATTPEEADKIKQALIYGDAPIPMGLKTPLMGDGLPAYTNADLPAAVAELKDALQEFETYYTQNKDAAHVHRRLGPLTHSEWRTFHGKHFTHHFKQFDIL